tara:strand:- start:27 stop:470 length:444 start_codon:yes stop_codon:yes gene_type:complete
MEIEKQIQHFLDVLIFFENNLQNKHLRLGGSLESESDSKNDNIDDYLINKFSEIVNELDDETIKNISPDMLSRYNLLFEQYLNIINNIKSNQLGPKSQVQIVDFLKRINSKKDKIKEAKEEEAEAARKASISSKKSSRKKSSYFWFK